MTERWRKRLGDLDKVTPSEDVFHRAHDGPQMPEEMIPRPPTGTRVVTGIAAFLVFALAIGVFAIPALRMDHEAGSATGAGLEPLWPARSLDDLETLQAHADSGTATWATDPEQVARRFATSVMGWSDLEILDSNGPPAVDWNDGGPIYGIGGVSTGVIATAVSCSNTAGTACETYGAPTDRTEVATPVPVYPTSFEPSPYRPYFLLDNQSGGSIAVTLYQPLESGDGKIWSVMEVGSDATLSTGVGDTLHDGDLLFGSQYLLDGGSLGYHAGSGDCQVVDSSPLIQRPMEASPPPPGAETQATPVPVTTYQGGQLTVDLGSLDGTDCPSSLAGYAWVATSASGSVTDPLAAGSSQHLSGLSAVPVIFSREEGPTYQPTDVHTGTSTGSGSATVAPTSSSSPISWVGYRDPLGWTAQVPDSWDSTRIDTMDRVTIQGVEWRGDGLTVTITHRDGGAYQQPTDDSTFPLVADDILKPTEGGGWEGQFNGDGLPFQVYILEDSNASTLTQAQGETVTHIVESIAFSGWSPGETRNGWTALPPEPDLVNLTTINGATYLVLTRVESNSNAKVFGPIPSCAGESFATDPATGVTQTCGDGTTTTYGYDGSGLPEIAVIVAWDGSRLVQVT